MGCPSIYSSKLWGTDRGVVTTNNPSHNNKSFRRLFRRIFGVPNLIIGLQLASIWEFHALQKSMMGSPVPPPYQSVFLRTVGPPPKYLVLVGFALLAQPSSNTYRSTFDPAAPSIAFMAASHA